MHVGGLWLDVENTNFTKGLLLDPTQKAPRWLRWRLLLTVPQQVASKPDDCLKYGDCCKYMQVWRCAPKVQKIKSLSRRKNLTRPPKHDWYEMSHQQHTCPIFLQQTTSQQWQLWCSVRRANTCILEHCRSVTIMKEPESFGFRIGNNNNLWWTTFGPAQKDCIAEFLSKFCGWS